MVVQPPTPPPSSPPLSLLLLTSVPDLTAVSFISAILLLSLFSIFFIIHFRLKTHQSIHLKDFNSLWTVRILFVSFISLWSLSHVLRFPSIIPHCLSLDFFSVEQQINLCKTHIVLSQGLFQPGFLIILLYLVNISVMKKNPKKILGKSILFVLLTVIPLLTLQIFFIFFSNNFFSLPEIFSRGHIIKDGDDKVICTYPLISSITFGTFAILYIIFFSLACWRVGRIVINKSLRVRIYVLVFTVITSISIQILFLVLSAFWRAADVAFEWLGLVVFLTVLMCAVIGEGILVIKPIADALAVGGSYCRCDNDYRL